MWPEVEHRFAQLEGLTKQGVSRSILAGTRGIVILVVLLLLLAVAVLVALSNLPLPSLPTVNRFVYVSRSDIKDDGRLFVTDAAGGTPQLLYDSFGQQLFMSPNGQYVVFSALLEDELVIARTDGSAILHLPTAYLGREWEQIWAPDSHAIAWDSPLSDELIVQSVTGSRRSISLPEGAASQVHEGQYQIRWSPDSRHVALHSYETDVPRRFLIVDTLDGGIVEVGSQLRVETPPVWSSDGSRLAAVVFSKGSPTLVIVDATTGHFQTLRGHFAGGLLAWSPLGKSIVYQTDAGIFDLPLAGGQATSIGPWPLGYLSPDGTAVVGFEPPDPGTGTWDLVVYELASGISTVVAHDVEASGPSEWPKWSPDGQWIAFHRDVPSSGSDRTSIWVVGRSGADEHLITEVWDFDLADADW
jgi:Tol biopolymer transport system component